MTPHHVYGMTTHFNKVGVISPHTHLINTGDQSITKNRYYALIINLEITASSQLICVYVHVSTSLVVACGRPSSCSYQFVTFHLNGLNNQFSLHGLYRTTCLSGTSQSVVLRTRRTRTAITTVE